MFPQHYTGLIEFHFQGNRCQSLIILVQNLGLNTGLFGKLKFREMYSFCILPCYWN